MGRIKRFIRGIVVVSAATCWFLGAVPPGSCIDPHPEHWPNADGGPNVSLSGRLNQDIR